MEAKIYIEELSDFVTFTARIYRLSGPMARHPKFWIDDIQWESEKYSKEENLVIEKYIEQAVSALFETLKEEAI